MISKAFKDAWGYVLAGILSVIALVFIPLLGSNLGVIFAFPTTVAGWFVYIVQKGTSAVVNILMLSSFKSQAKLNIRDNENYKLALGILQKCKPKEYKPRSPAKYNAKVYGMKGSTIFIGSIVGTIGITNAILTYDYLQLISYVFVLTFGAIFGFRQMKKDEEYWTEEYLDYARRVEDGEKSLRTN